ncbi:MAG: 3'-5' exonuclease [Odoribacter sp.]
MYLFFDTETTGLPKRWNAPVTDVDNWPRLVQLAWIMCNEEGEIIDSREVIIRPDGFVIPSDVVQLHHITTQIATEKGLPILEVMEQFADKVDEAFALIGHNISFDECIVGAEFERLRMMTSLFLKPKYCTMKSSTNYCKLPGKKGFKSPKLSELHQILFGVGFDNAHNALADVEATARCFWELKKRGVIR